MVAPTPIRHRRYSKQVKLAAVIAAEATSVAAAADAKGIPMTTVAYWYNSPEFAELRNKTREDRAEMASALSIKVVSEINRRLPEFEPRDLSVLLGILTDKAQLLSGAATHRTETRDLTTAFDDEEWDKLKEVLREAANAGG